MLLDRDAEGLATVAKGIGTTHPGLTVTTYVVDLADADATSRVAEALRTGHPQITLLVNNAGVALGGRFDQVTLKEFARVQEINLRAMVRLTHALLPTLKAHPGAHLVNVSSLFGLMAPAGQAAYAASKFAVRGFTEALRHELAEDGVGVTSVHPAGSAPGSPRAPAWSGGPRRRGRAGQAGLRPAADHGPGQGRRPHRHRDRAPAAAAAGRLERRRPGPAGAAGARFLRPGAGRADRARRPAQELTAAG